MEKLVDFLQNSISIEKVSAHCDIPCKIYDPISSQIAVLTMIRIIDLIEDLDVSDNANLNNKAQLSRLISQKEEHGIKVKEEIRVIWGDYFKKPQIDQFSEIHELTHSIMLLCSKSKQNVNRQSCLDLLDKVNRFAEIFWLTKDIKIFREKCPYPPEMEIVYPDLK